MGLMKLKLIDGSDEILADPDLKKMDPKLLWYTIAHPSLAWGEENFCLEKIVVYNDVGGDHYGGADGRGDRQCSPYRHRGGGHLHWCSLQRLPLLLPRLAVAERLYPYSYRWCRCCRRPHGCWAAVLSDDRWASTQPWGRCAGDQRVL
jgi:hypothetical protein